MRLNEALNLVLPCGNLQAHHSPISREVFEANYRILAATRAALSGKGVVYQMYAGPRIAKLALLDESKADAEEREHDTGPAFLAELKRLTVILCPTPQGFTPMPVDAAIQGNHIDAEDWAEAEAGIVFFTCVWSMESRAERTKVAQAMASLLKGSTTSSSASEFAASLAASTKEPDSTSEGSAGASFPT